MGVKGLRPLRVAAFIQRELSQLLLMKVRDARLHNVVITRVEVSPDLRHAEIYIRTLGGSLETLMPLLEKATPFFTRKMRPLLHIKHAMRFSFHEDTRPEAMEHIEKLLEDIKDDSHS